MNAGCHHISLGTNLSVGNERHRKREHIHEQRQALGGGRHPRNLGRRAALFFPLGGPITPATYQDLVLAHRCQLPLYTVSTSKRWWQRGNGPERSTWRSWICPGVPYLAVGLRIRILFPTSPIYSAPAFQGEVRTMNEQSGVC